MRSLLLLAASPCLPAATAAERAKEIAYVSAPQAFLRDQVAAVYNKTGTVKNGEAVQILARDRRFARVRTSAGAEGWLEQRYLVTRQTYDAFQKLADQSRNDPVQATALAHNQSNIHLAAGARCRTPVPGRPGCEVVAAEACQQRRNPCPEARPEAMPRERKRTAAAARWRTGG